MIKYNNLKELIQVLYNRLYYFTFKNPAENITLDYEIGKEKTKVTINFEYKTKRVYHESKKIKQILKTLKKRKI